MSYATLSRNTVTTRVSYATNVFATRVVVCRTQHCHNTCGVLRSLRNCNIMLQLRRNVPRGGVQSETADVVRCAWAPSARVVKVRRGVILQSYFVTLWAERRCAVIFCNTMGVWVLCCNVLGMYAFARTCVWHRACAAPPHAASVTQTHAAIVTQTHAASVTQTHAASVTQTHAAIVAQTHAASVTQTHAASVTQMHAASVTHLMRARVYLSILCLHARSALLYACICVHIYP